MTLLRSVLIVTALSCARPTASIPDTSPLQYPLARSEDVSDDYFGTRVADPYRWLEDPDSDETRGWIEAQNKLTRSWIDAVPQRATIRARLEKLKDFERYSAPFEKGGRYFYTRNDGLQAQDVLYVSEGLDAAPRVLLDPNTLSADGTVALAGTRVSEDGRWLAYGTSDGGSDWTTWRVRDVATGQDLDDTLRWIRFSGAAWTHDHQGFFYTRYPENDNPLQAVPENNQVFYHKLGTPQEQDTLVYARPDHPRWSFGPSVSEDGSTLLIYGFEGTEPKNRVWYKDLRDPKAELKPLIEAHEAQYLAIGNEGSRFLFFTNKDAPNGKIVAIDLNGPAPERWQVVIPEAAEPLEDCSWVGGKLIATYLKDARSEVRLFTPDGQPQGELVLPEIGSVWGFAGEQDEPETFYLFTNFTRPSALYRYDVSTGQSTLWKQAEVDFDPSAYETEQVFYASKDGTRVPMFLVHKKGLEKNGDNPTLLYGYGGFGISLTPAFSDSLVAWLELGGLYAVPNLRGGGEYGETWHQAGTLKNKQNVFDDFIAAAEWLIANKYTSSDKLSIRGRSNGGLLVGAALTQRPDLFGATLPGVGVLDMLRYHLYTVGWAWASDYGRSDDPDMFPVLFRYSPLHNIKSGTRYPATLVTTADHDDRVMPAHSFKFAAALQSAQAGPAPVLLRVETRAGHGAGMPTQMRLDLAADEYAFLVRALGM